MEIGFKTLGLSIMTFKDVEYCFRKQSLNQHMSPILFQGWKAGNRTYENGQTRYSAANERKGISKVY